GSQPVLTQPPSASASLGASVTLTCTLSSGYSNYKVDWYQQRPGKGPRFVMRVGTGGIVGSKGDGIADRFSVSGSGLNRSLTIKNIQEEDESDYHCGADHGSGDNFVRVFGGGTKLTVLGGGGSGGGGSGGGGSQVQLQESGPGLVKPSQTLSLTCSVSGVSLSGGSYTWNWIRQPAGKGLEWIGRIFTSGSTNYNPSLKGRLTMSIDTSKNQLSLRLSSVTAADTAVYYCVADYYYSVPDVWGQGTPVTVSS
uniref:Variable domain of antibody scFv9 n=1 Tax=Homo sapiens TaxID=9606 RepID=UPI0012FE7E97|nr:Chain B, Variable domain of antibody scFv9 [Homo sapiens]6PCU_E Chain E, Variable domain of antibody scFv9 [Homo sapiens]6PCU_H Chain H, Variable domain of antibody scFv9 [Homo sapiens]